MLSYVVALVDFLDHCDGLSMDGSAMNKAADSSRLVGVIQTCNDLPPFSPRVAQKAINIFWGRI